MGVGSYCNQFPLGRNRQGRLSRGREDSDTSAGEPLTQLPLAELTFLEWDVLFSFPPSVLSLPYPPLSGKYPASSRKLPENLSDVGHGCG